jgi:hypothetical protein
MPPCSAPPPEPFTWAQYAGYLDLARANGYAFATFDEPLPGPAEPARRVLLRHDIDYDLAAVPPIAGLEADRGIRATYFYQTRCRFYDLARPDAAARVRAVLDRGHALGLHFDATEIAGDDAALAGVETAARELEDRFGTRVAAVSFHMPTHRPVRHLVPHGGRINTYGPVFFDRVAYVSDSNQQWRGKDLADVLARQRPAVVQVLTHPVWWRPTYTPLLTILRELADRLGLDVARDILSPEQRALIDPGDAGAAA